MFHNLLSQLHKEMHKPNETNQTEMAQKFC